MGRTWFLKLISIVCLTLGATLGFTPFARAGSDAAFGAAIQLGLSYSEGFRAAGGNSAFSLLGGAQLVWKAKMGEVGIFVDSNMTQNSTTGNLDAPLFFGTIFKFAPPGKSTLTFHIKLDPITTLIAVLTPSYYYRTTYQFSDYFTGIGLGFGYRIQGAHTFIEPGFSIRYFYHPWPWTYGNSILTSQKILSADFGILIGF